MKTKDQIKEILKDNYCKCFCNNEDWIEKSAIEIELLISSNNSQNDKKDSKLDNILDK